MPLKILPVHLSGKPPLGYVWFSENLRENVRERKYKGKIEGKKKWKKIKNGLKVDKLFLFFTSNSFYLF